MLERAAQYAARHLRFNLVMLFIDSTFFFIGLAFFDGSTVIPVFLRSLGASDTLIGASKVLSVLGVTVPALYASHHIHGRATHKRFLMQTVIGARVGLWLLPLAIMLWAQSMPWLVIACFFVVYGTFWTIDGCSGVSWFDIVAKTVPPRARGRFFGVMQTLGGIAAMVAGVGVAAALGKHGLRFPYNYAALALAWALGGLVSTVALGCLREPHGIMVQAEDKPSFIQFLGQTLPMLRRHPRLVHLAITRFLLDGAGLASSFYVLFATGELKVPLAMIGVYTIVQNVGRVCSGPVWGAISDRMGPRVSLRWVGLLVLLGPACGLASVWFGAWLFPVLFFCVGASGDGVWTTCCNLMLETVDERDRPLAIGSMGLIQTTSAVFGVLGGLLVQSFGFTAAFAAAFGFALVGFVMAVTMPRLVDG